MKRQKGEFENTVAKGRRAEALSARIFRARGFSVLAQNLYFGHTGEIDLILNRGKRLYFVEVKSCYRGGSEENVDPLEQIQRQKLLRIRRCAEIYVNQHMIWQFHIHFLAVSVLFSEGNRLLKWSCVPMDEA